MTPLTFPEGRRFDLACLGRLAVDLYAQQVGCALEDASSFAKYLGGSSANIAFGAARLGLKTAMISRVGDEQMGRFLLRTLANEGCDTSQVQVDPERLTALVLLGLKDRDTFPLVFYRENCADMALAADGIGADFIADCRALLITGTHLSQPMVRAASMRALDHAERHGTVRVLDIDYRPVLWGLTGRGDGETRFVADARVTASLQAVLPRFELLIGTEEEFRIAGGLPGDLLASLRRVRELTGAALVVKRGALGCSYVPGAVPARLDDALTVHGERVEVLNVLGAGDAFAAGLLTGLLRGQPFEQAARLANACGAIVVSRHACAPAMPTPAELDHWFSGRRAPRVDSDAALAHLHRVTAPRPAWPELNVLAFDHRSQFDELVREAGAATSPDAAEVLGATARPGDAVQPPGGTLPPGSAAPIGGAVPPGSAVPAGGAASRIPALKLLLLRAAEAVERSRGLHGRIGVLIDGGHGEAALQRATGRGWWVGRPVEWPGSRPLRFDGTRSIGSRLAASPREQVVKCLVFFHPDDAVELRLEQEARLLELWEATRLSGHELLLEVILPRDRRTDDDNDADALVLRAVRRLYNIGLKPEWWKLAPMAAVGWESLAALLAQRDPHCRGVVILGLNQPLAALADSFAAARHPVVKGFMVGRTLWAEPSLAWLQGRIDDGALVDAVAGNFAALVDAWRASRPVPANHPLDRAAR